jgi:hypothetical protein
MINEVKLDALSGPTWYRRNAVLIHRFFQDSRELASVADELKIPLAAAKRTISIIVELGATNRGYFRRSLRAGDPEYANALFVTLPVHKWVRDLAGKIASAIERSSGQHPSIARAVIDFYTTSVHSNNRVMVKADADVARGRQFATFVRTLRVHEIWPRPIAFKCGDRKTTELLVKKRLAELELTSEERATLTHVPVHNRHYPESVEGFAIDVGCRRRNGEVLSSEAFRYAMTVSAASEIWAKAKTKAESDAQPKSGFLFE